MKIKNWVVFSLSLLMMSHHVLAGPFDLQVSKKIEENFNQQMRIVNINHLKEEQLKEIMEGHCPEMIVEFTAQTQLPLTLFLNGDLVSLKNNEDFLGTIEIKQTFYARCVEHELLLSLNLIDWKPLLEFMSGSITMALSNQEGYPSIGVGAEVNLRA